MYISPKAYPYLPEDRVILYVPEENIFMARAKEIWQSHNRYCRLPTSTVIVKKNIIIAEGKNGGKNPPEVCQRKILGCKTGEGYELCPGCDPKNHAEPTALKLAGLAAYGADVYLYGHWWYCQSCWQAMISAGIRNVYLVAGATEKFST